MADSQPHGMKRLSKEERVAQLQKMTKKGDRGKGKAGTSADLSPSRGAVPSTAPATRVVVPPAAPGVRVVAPHLTAPSPIRADQGKTDQQAILRSARAAHGMTGRLPHCPFLGVSGRTRGLVMLLWLDPSRLVGSPQSTRRWS